MPEDRLPRTPEEIDPRWLTRQLAVRYPGARVAQLVVREVRQVTNSHSHIHIDYDAPTTAPTEMFCKMPPLDPERREIIARSQMGPNEVRFYTRLAPELPGFRIPMSMWPATTHATSRS